ncbi:nuclease-related domain-containing protein [Aeromicrobium sp. NPDC092404]|uniref:nuclease-related domain-containing protein n=1 Tax=Aeromicrobium sp. NPDC092404 TaxID=3154976 RepID=UPI003437AB71
MGTSDVKIMQLRRDGECVCGALVPRGTTAGWHPELRIVLCATCLKLETPPTPIEVGTPGGSLQREYERRRAAREKRTRERHPHIGGLLLRLAGPVRTTEAFAVGARGEREAAEKLQREVGDTVLFLFNRKRGTGRTSGDIDIIAIAPSGVWIIDPKKYVGKKVRANRAGTMFVIGGTRRPQLSESMRRQIEVVTAGVRSGPAPTAPVRAAYCFIGADLPWSSLTVDGVAALTMRGTVKALREPGPLGADERARLHADLSHRFPPA